jgi:sugar/nucleoside kinase (ribokinase family)
MSEQSGSLTYRLIGHACNDLTPDGPMLGGTVTYSGLTAGALGADVGILTACAADVDLQPIAGTELISFPSSESTVFRNREHASGRTQTLVSRSRSLSLDMLPVEWRGANVIHLAPIADEIELNMLGEFHSDSIFMTPQGWMRQWDVSGIVQQRSWRHIREALASARAVVCSLEDLGNDPVEAEAVAQVVRLLVVTLSENGAWLFEAGSRTEIAGMQVEEVSPTGAGDIFAAVFFFEITDGSDPLAAARRANYLAAQSITRVGLESIPTQLEIQRARGIE